VAPDISCVYYYQLSLSASLWDGSVVSIWPSTLKSFVGWWDSWMFESCRICKFFIRWEPFLSGDCTPFWGIISSFWHLHSVFPAYQFDSGALFLILIEKHSLGEEPRILCAECCGTLYQLFLLLPHLFERFVVSIFVIYTIEVHELRLFWSNCRYRLIHIKECVLLMLALICLSLLLYFVF